MRAAALLAMFLCAAMTTISAAAAAAAAEVPFAGTFKLPDAERRLWRALNEPTAEAMRLEWAPVDPAKDPARPDGFWRQWPAPFSGFFAGVKLPAEQFVLPNLYHDGQLFYPQAQYERAADYVTFLDLHESLAWLYAFDSPANPYFRSKALRLRARQLALAHLVGMVQEAPAGNIIGGWPIQYGNCVAWNARVLRWLDETEPVEPELKRAWIECMQYVLATLDAQGPNVLETGMGHWNLWPVVGAFELWRASHEPKDRALYEKWAKVQLTPDAFTSRARFVSGISPVGYERYSGVDLGYNGQAKNWMVPLYAAEGVDSIVGDFARRQYQFASFVTLGEPGGTLSSVQHMNSHSTQSVPYEQWAFHEHIGYAIDIPDARPFAARLATTRPGAAADLVARQHQMEGMKVVALEPISFGVRSYPSDYLHLPPALAWYPKSPLPDLKSPRTRPMEHLAYAKWFRSPVVRDEFFLRRMPAYHATIYSGPCRDEVSNYGGRLNGIGAGGLGQLWIDGAGTALMAATDLKQKPSAEGDFDAVWSQLAINAMVGVRADGKVVCTGWTGSLMEADPRGEQVTIHDGLAPGVEVSYRTPMMGRGHWRRRVHFAPDGLDVEASADAGSPLRRAAELLPIAFFKDTKVSGVDEAGQAVAGPWEGEKRVSTVVVHRGKGEMRVRLEKPLAASWGEMRTTIEPAVGQEAYARALRLWLEPAGGEVKVRYRIELSDGRGEPAPVVRVRAGAVLPKAKVGAEYRAALEADDARAVYWTVGGGELPPGLTLHRNGLLSGVLHSAGVYRFKLAGSTPYGTRPFFEKDVAPVEVELTVQR